VEFDTYISGPMLTAVDLVNSYDAARDAELLTDAAALTELLRRHEWMLGELLDDRHLTRFRALRQQLRRVFDTQVTPDRVAALNAMLTKVSAAPQLTDHDGTWHWHYLPRGAALIDRATANCAAALLGVIVRDNGSSRLRTCAADGCANVFVDASRNGKRRFCDSRSCGNRVHAAAYRARNPGGQPS